MKCTRVLHMLNSPTGGSSPIMPVDMAMRICLASSPPLHSLLRNYDDRCSKSVCCEPLRPCLASSSWGDAFSYTIATTTASKTTASAEINGDQTWPKRKKKKSVVFADTQGLALAYVHVFDEAEEDLLTEMQFHLKEIEDATAGLHLGNDKGPAESSPSLVLDFTQPSADYLDLRNRLKAQQVCLESCSVQDRLLSGTVQVKNLCFDKSVSVRITFDSWRSFQDVPCLYLNNVYGCPDTDTFSFSVMIPEFLDLSNRVEFCIQYWTPDQTFWDNNRGINYQLVPAEPNGSPCRSSKRITGLEIQRDRARERREGMEFDPFGSPRTSAGIFPEWQSWVRVETAAPYW